MKKYFVIAAAALVAMCACTKNEVNQLPDEAITFQVANYSAATKADGCTDSLLCGNNNFHVEAYYKLTKDWDGTVANLYMSDVVKHQDSAWKTKTDYYWPKTGYLSFLAWSPAEIANAQSVEYTKDDSIKITSYAIPTTPGKDNQLDILTSFETGSQNLNFDNQRSNIPDAGTDPDYSYNHSGVPMLFRHILAKLNFNLEYNHDNLTADQAALFTIQVDSLVLNDLGSTATYSKGSWAAATATKDTVVFKKAPAAELTSTADKQTGYVADYFIIPQGQVDKKGMSLTVYYKVNGEDCDPETISLATTNIKSWAKNKIYTYNLRISPVLDGPNDKPITFDPAVAAWETVTAEEVKVEEEAVTEPVGE